MTSKRVWTADEITEQVAELHTALGEQIIPAAIGGFVGGFLFGAPLPRKRKRITTTERKDSNATDNR